MDRGELLRRSDALKPNGRWVTAVGGRWHEGTSQFRVREAPIPKGRAFSWYWWHNLNPTSFEQRRSQLANEGSRLVHSQTYALPDGSKRYQSVWAKAGN